MTNFNWSTDEDGRKLLDEVFHRSRSESRSETIRWALSFLDWAIDAADGSGGIVALPDGREVRVELVVPELSR